MVPDDGRDGRRDDDGAATRRRFLRVTAGAAAATGLAGCSALPPLGGGIRFGRVDVPAPDPPVYRQWLPAPSALEGPPDEDYSVIHSRPARFLERRPAPVGAIGMAVLSSGVDWFGYPLADVDRAIAAGEVRIFRGDFETTTVQDALQAGEYERRDTYRDATIYGRPENRVAAVGEGVVLWCRGEAAAADVRRVLDARAGAIERRHEVDEDFAVLSEHVGASLDTLYNFTLPDPTDELLDATLSIRMDEGSVYYVQDGLYPPGTEIPVEAIKDELDQQGRPGEAEAVDVETDGRIVSVEMRLTNEQVGADLPSEADPTPLITWDHTVDGDEVTVRHIAGESVPADRLSIDLTGIDDEDGLWADRYETVGPGDELTVTTPVGARSIVVVYEPHENASTAVYTVDLEGAP